MDDDDEGGDFAHVMMTILMSLKVAVFTLQKDRIECKITF